MEKNYIYIVTYAHLLLLFFLAMNKLYICERMHCYMQNWMIQGFGNRDSRNTNENQKNTQQIDLTNKIL